MWEMCCHFVWLLGNVLPYFRPCWITQPSRMGFKVFGKDWQGRTPVPYLYYVSVIITYWPLAFVIYMQVIESSDPFLGCVLLGKEDKEEVTQGVRVQFKGKWPKIKIVWENCAKRDSDGSRLPGDWIQSGFPLNAESGYKSRQPHSSYDRSRGN